MTTLNMEIPSQEAPSIQQERAQDFEQGTVNLAQLSPQVDTKLDNQLDGFTQEQQAYLKDEICNEAFKVGGERATIDILQFNIGDNKIYGQVNSFHDITVDPVVVLAQTDRQRQPLEQQGPTLEYERMSDSYQIRQTAYLPAEGVGVNGSYFFKGHITVDNDELFISGKGFTAASHLGRVAYNMNAAVLVDGNEVSRTQLRNDEPGMWDASDNYIPVGSARIPLPEVKEGQKVQVVITGSYNYTQGHGYAVPIPPTTNQIIELKAK